MVFDGSLFFSQAGKITLLKRTEEEEKSMPVVNARQKKKARSLWLVSVMYVAVSWRRVGEGEGGQCQ